MSIVDGGFTPPAPRERTSMPRPDVSVLVREFYDRLWNAWDEAAVHELLDRDFTFRGTLGVTAYGRNGWRDYREQVREGAPDLRVQVIQVLAAGAGAAARLLLTGTHTGELLGVAATHRPFVFAGSAFFETRHSRITQVWALGDLTHLRQQLTA